MAGRDIVSKHGTQRIALQSATPGAGAVTNANGADINSANYNGVMFYILPGTITDSSILIVIQEADDNGSGAAGTYANVAATDLVLWKATSMTDYTPVKVGGAQPVAMNNNATIGALNQRVGYIGGKQWVRATTVITASGSSTGGVYNVICELGEPRNMPAAV